MERRLIIFIAAVSLITACTKSSIPETAGDSHEIVVSISDSQIDTKSTVNIVSGRGKTSFSPGDQIVAISINNKGDQKQAVYTYKSTQSGEGVEKYVFQKDFNGQIDTNSIAAAFYPNSLFNKYENDGELISFTVSFSQDQMYTQNGTQVINAPMACFEGTKDSLVFSNLSCLLRIGIKCCTDSENEIVIQTISVTANNTKTCLFGNYTYYYGYDTVWGPAKSPKARNSVSLIGCDSAGAISTDTKYFYIFLPPLSQLDDGFSGDTFTVAVNFVSGKSHTETFTVPANMSGGNLLIMNSILDFPPIKINPAKVL